MKKDSKPLIVSIDTFDDTTFERIEDSTQRESMRRWATRVAKGRPFLERRQSNIDFALQNVSVAECFNCNEVTLWIYGRLVWPLRGEAPMPNPDLPEEIRVDYEEASSILDLSPRGAAALLRLGIQRLCQHLGERGKDINSDIASLVKKGLDQRVQQALDIVRVVGNNAVHPGQMDLRDDRGTAEKLFALVNLITEITISQPKHVRAMFEGLPEAARAAIEKRDASE